jgi:hypothetical protein
LFFILHTLLKIIICQTLVACTIYTWLYIGIICIMQKHYLKWISFFCGKISHHGEKTIAWMVQRRFFEGKKKGTKIATFLGGKCLNLSYLNNTFLRLVKQSKILILFYFPTWALTKVGSFFLEMITSPTYFTKLKKRLTSQPIW